MFSLSKGEPPTPPTTATTSPTADAAVTACELPQFETSEAPLEHSRPSSNQIDVPIRDIPPIRTQPAPFEPDSGFESSPFCISGPGGLFQFGDDNDFGYDEVFLDDEESMFLFGREDDDELCPSCDRSSSCSGSRAESSATVRAAMSNYTDPNTCDSDASNRSSSPQSPPPPSSSPIPATCSILHNDRLPCPRCSRVESLEGPTSYLQSIVASRSYPGSYPASLLQWWNQSSSSVFSPRVAAALSRTSNRSDDRRSSRSRRRQIDSDASSSSSCDENSADELFPTCEGASYLSTMTEVEEVRVTSPEQLPDLVPLSSESSSRRGRSQSVSIPLDHEYIREIGISLRRFSNEFENRFAERNGRSRRLSLTSFLNWRS